MGIWFLIGLVFGVFGFIAILMAGHDTKRGL
jgi:hypothetical protein